MTCPSLSALSHNGFFFPFLLSFVLQPVGRGSHCYSLSLFTLRKIDLFSEVVYLLPFFSEEAEHLALVGKGEKVLLFFLAATHSIP